MNKTNRDQIDTEFQQNGFHLISQWPVRNGKCLDVYANAEGSRVVQISFNEQDKADSKLWSSIRATNGSISKKVLATLRFGPFATGVEIANLNFASYCSRCQTLLT